MPYRDDRSKVDAYGTYQGYTARNSIDRMRGVYQTLSNRNNTGKYIPGVYYANPVMIEKWTGKSNPIPRPIEMKNSFGYWGVMGGHVPAVAAQAAVNLDYARSRIGTESSQLHAYTINRALAKACKPSTEVGVMIGELRETLQGLINPFSSVRKLLANLIHGTVYYGGRMARRRLRKDVLNSIASSHLEVRLGLIPTWNSICDVIDSVYRQMRRINGKLLREKGRYVLQPVRTNKMTSFSLNGISAFVQVDEERTESYTASIFYHQDRGLTFNEEMGLSGEHSLAIAWELVPLSFVVDRFLDIGTFLQTLAFDAARSLNGICVSRKVELNYHAWLSKATFWGIESTEFRGDASFRYEYYNRTVNLSRPLLPAVNPNLLGVVQTLDHLALIAQSLLKKKRA